MVCWKANTNPSSPAGSISGTAATRRHVQLPKAIAATHLHTSVFMAPHGRGRTPLSDLPGLRNGLRVRLGNDASDRPGTHRTRAARVIPGGFWRDRSTRVVPGDNHDCIPPI